MWWVGICVMVAVVTAHNMGLPQEIAKVVTKVCSCPKCLSFWLSLSAMLWVGVSIIPAVTLAVFMAYASHYFSFVLLLLNKLYDKIWEVISKPKSQSGKRQTTPRVGS
jgi:hypothetical protein